MFSNALFGTLSCKETDFAKVVLQLVCIVRVFIPQTTVTLDVTTTFQLKLLLILYKD